MMHPIVEESVLFTDSDVECNSREGSFVLGPPIVPEQVDLRHTGARWSDVSPHPLLAQKC